MEGSHQCMLIPFVGNWPLSNLEKDTWFLLTHREELLQSWRWQRYTEARILVAISSSGSSTRIYEVLLNISCEQCHQSWICNNRSCELHWRLKCMPQLRTDAEKTGGLMLYHQSQSFPASNHFPFFETLIHLILFNREPITRFLVTRPCLFLMLFVWFSVQTFTLPTINILW